MASDTESDGNGRGTTATVAVGSVHVRWRFDRYEFDPEGRELLVDGKRRPLEDRTAAVLTCLLEHADQVVSRTLLLASAWPGQIVTEGAVAKAIMKLRAALGVSAGQLLLTVHGLGYRLATAATRDRIEARPEALHLQAGAHLPQRPHWRVLGRNGQDEAGESWRLRHDKTGEVRLLRLASTGPEATRLRACIASHRRLLHALPHRSDLLRLVEAEEARNPILAEFAGPCRDNLGGDRARTWLASLADAQQRLDIACSIVEAVAAAHSAGVAHGWLRDEHVLLSLAAERPALALWGFSATTAGNDNDNDPHQALQREDVHWLGRLLLRLVCADLDADLSPGWERRIDDPTLCEDIARACDADPARRPRDAVELVAVLRSQPERSRQQTAMAADRALLARQAQALIRARRRWRWAALLVLVATVFAAVSLYLLQQAQQARDSARQAQATAQTINEFLINDLIGQAEPFYGLGTDVRLIDVIAVAEAGVEQRFGAQPLIAAEMTLALGRIHLGLGLWNRAEALLARALELAGADWPDGHPMRLLAEFNLGDLLVRQARFVEARALYRDVHAAQLLQFGNDAEDTRWTRTQLAWIEHELGDSATAAALLEQILDEMPVGTADPALSDLAEHYLALTEHELGLWAQAERRYLALRERVAGWRGEEHPAVAQVARNLGALWVDMGKTDAAIELLRSALASMSARLDSSHPEVLALQAELGKALLERGDHETALRILEIAGENRRHLLGIEHDRTRHTLSRLAQARYRNGEHASALTLANEVVAASDRHLGTDHPESALFRFRLALLLAEHGEQGAAEAEAEAGWQATEQRYGATHPRSLAMRLRVVEWDLAAGRVDAARGRSAAMPAAALASLPELHPIRVQAQRIQTHLEPVP